MRGAATVSLSFFFNDTATTEIYTLSLHDALPISRQVWVMVTPKPLLIRQTLKSKSKRTTRKRKARHCTSTIKGDRKSTRLNSSHSQISYAVFCLKKKNTRAALAYNLWEIVRLVGP